MPHPSGFRVRFLKFLVTPSATSKSSPSLPQGTVYVTIRKITLMALTRDFKETIRASVKRDPGFRKALLREGIENFLSGDVETGKIILRDFINATVGFTKLSGVTRRSPKSLMRMLGPRGNPQARNLFKIVAYLQRAEGVRFEVRSARATSSLRKHRSA